MPPSSMMPVAASPEVGYALRRSAFDQLVIRGFPGRTSSTVTGVGCPPCSAIPVTPALGAFGGCVPLELDPGEDDDDEL